MTLPARIDPSQQTWLRSTALLRIFDAFKQAGGELRMVGGCVRDALAGRPVSDIDLCTPFPPEKTIAAIEKAGLKTAPTGIEHGTVTAIAEKKGFEITTLRRDVETDGRRAKVEFTDDWQADAARRDFTMNALYADADGKVYDYFNGRDDLATGHVRFIGKAEDRIQEDVLRILRFFRFHAWFGRGAASAEGLEACARHASLIPNLSAERVWREVNKLLGAPNPVPSWQLLIDHGILPHLLPNASNTERLTKLIEAERRFRANATSLSRLAALLPKKLEAAQAASRRLKMSNRESDALKKLATMPTLLRGKLDPMPFRHVLYEFGADNAAEAALLYATEDPTADIAPALAIANDWQRPVFPLHGDDFIKLGLTPGPKLGESLRSIEDWWIARDFRPTREECLTEARDFLSLSASKQNAK